MKRKFLIVEDDVLIAEHIYDIVQASGNQVLKVCADKTEALLAIESETPHAAFLDIRLSGVDEGIEIGRLLNELGVPFAFVTSFSDKNTIQQAIDAQPRAYLLKPFDTEEIEDVISKLIDECDPVISIKVNGIGQELFAKDILYVNSDNIYLEIFTLTGKYLIREKLSDFQELLDPTIFVRIHRSYVINRMHVTKLKKDKVWLNQIEIPISRKYQTTIQELFNS